MIRPLVARAQRSLRAAALILSTAGLVGAPLSATWSIVVVDHATGEVGLASATCLGGSLSEFVGVLRAGKGAAAAQALESPYEVKSELYLGITKGLTPRKLLGFLEAQPNSFNKQYGIATFSGPPVSWSGEQTCQANPNRTGQVGGISYAIQGNILTGPEVVWAAEEALVGTGGDLGQRLLAAMEAARLWGGDGRCSCSPTVGCLGDACGAPPPNFDPDDPDDMSSCIGFVFVARHGDKNKPCSMTQGCARGDYYLRIEHEGICTQDPMPPLQQQYAAWRAALQGRPDGVLSEVEVGGLPLVADGVSQARVHVRLRDVEDAPVTTGGHAFSLDVAGKRPPKTELVEVIDRGEGRYTLVLASEKPGTEPLEIECDDFAGPQVTFFPLVDMEILAPGTVTSAAPAASARDGWSTIPFTVHGGASAAGRPFAVLVSAEEAPATLAVPRLVGSGRLDEEGRFEGTVEVPSGARPAWTVLWTNGDGEIAVTRS